MATIRAVFLDVGWTLAYPQKSMWQIFADLCADSSDLLAQWPPLQEAWNEYMVDDLCPTVNLFIGEQ